jgi:hypothetical protein
VTRWNARRLLRRLGLPRRLVATTRLALGAGGYGLLLAALGAERQTGTDLEYHDAAAALSDPPPQTRHYLAAAVHE